MSCQLSTHKELFFSAFNEFSSFYSLSLKNILTVSKVYWQAKVWGLLHDPVLKALHSNSGRGKNSYWQTLAVMQDWVELNRNPEASQSIAMQQIHLADLIASASDRGAIGSLSSSVDYAPKGTRPKSN